MSRRAVLRGVSIALLLAVAIVAGFAAWLLTTAGGRDFALERAEAMLPDGTSLGTAEGRLIGPLVLRDVRVVQGGATVAIERLELDWSQTALLASRVQVDYLRLHGVDVVLPSDGDEQTGPAGPPVLPDSLASPVPLRLGRLEVGPVQVDTGADSLGPFSLTLSAEHDGERITLDDLVVETPWAGVSGAVGLDAAAPFALDGDLAWRVHAADARPELAGSLALGGNLENLHLDLASRRPGVVDLDGRVQPFGPRPRWDLALRFDALDPPAWHAAAPPWPADGAIRIRGDATTTRIHGDLFLRATPLAGVDVDFDFAIDADGARIRGLALRARDRPAWVEAGGTIDWQGDLPAVDLDVDWGELAWPLADEAVRSAGGQLTLTGTPAAYEVDGRLRVAPAGYPQGRWDIGLNGDMEALERFAVTGHWLDAAWSLEGAADWSGEPAGRFGLRVERFDPGRFDPRLSGDIDGAMRGTWALSGDEPEVDIRLERLAGTLAGETVSGEGGVAVRGERIRLRDVRLAVGGASLELDGDATPEPDLAFALTVDQMAELFDDAGGSLRADGRIHGDLPRPGLSLDFAAEDLRWRQSTIDDARIQAELPTDLEAEATLTGRIDGLVHNGQRIDGVDLGLDGTLANHTLEARARRDDDAVRLVLAGGYREPEAWRGELRALELAPAGFAAWRLERPVAVELARDAASLAEAACLVAGDEAPGRACVSGDWQAGAGWRADARIEDLALAPWVALLAPDLQAHGELDLHGQARGGAGQPPRAEVELRASPGRIDIPDADADDGRLELIAWETVHGNAALDADGMRASLDAPLAPDGRIEARLERGPGDGAQPLDGRLRIESGQLSLLARVVPEIGRIEGRVDVALDLAGTTERPVVNGSAALVDGLVTLPDPGLTLTDVTADISGETDGLRMRIGATSGSGRLEGEAFAQRRQQGAWSVRGTLAGDNFRAINTADARVDISPDIDWHAAGRAIEVNGELDVPWARITPHDLGSAVQSSPDVEIVGMGRQPGDGTSERWRVSADIQVNLGDAVRFDGFGLNGRIAGGLRLRQPAGELTRATGEVNVVDGTYRAYRQELTIERGRLIYNGGPVTEPGLDLRAVRRPRDVLVGVQVRGTLREPEATLFSEPTMQQSEILSYLVLGIPLGEAGEGDRSALNSAVAGASGWLAGRVGEGIGIDNVAIEEGATEEETELVLGTYLHPRLYVSYGVGLFESFSRVRLRYSLSERWSLEGESGPSSSGDLIYSIER